MHNNHYSQFQTERFVTIQVISSNNINSTIEFEEAHRSQAQGRRINNKFNFSAMKLFSRFRKVIMRLMFSVPSSSSSSANNNYCSSSSSRHRNSSSDRFEPPKTSCSSYYSSYSHYNEAISDCIEFLNKSSSSSAQDHHAFFNPTNSDLVWSSYTPFCYILPFTTAFFHLLQPCMLPYLLLLINFLILHQLIWYIYIYSSDSMYTIYIYIFEILQFSFPIYCVISFFFCPLIYIYIYATTLTYNCTNTRFNSMLLVYCCIFQAIYIDLFSFNESKIYR